MSIRSRHCLLVLVFLCSFGESSCTSWEAAIGSSMNLSRNSFGPSSTAFSILPSKHHNHLREKNANICSFQSQFLPNKRHRSIASIREKKQNESILQLHARNPLIFEDIVPSSIQDLPIYELIDTIRDAMAKKPNLLLEASPGAGKTTVIPLLVSSLLNSEWDTNQRQSQNTIKKVIVVEPRRVAARSAAQRMSKLIDQPVGNSVGYAIRGETRQSTSPEIATQIMVMTEGILLNMLKTDPELSGYHAVILDEFHERNVGSDVALALLREVQLNLREDLKLVVMSATLLGEIGSTQENGKGSESSGSKLLRVLGGNDSCNIVRSEGRQYPIAMQYAPRGSPPHGSLLLDTKLLVQTMSNAIEEGLSKAPGRGDVLAFLPGAKEIRRVVEELNSRGLEGADIFPLYGALPKDAQDRAIYRDSSENRRRIIVSTPIAEASLTIEGVTCVVDSGLRREPRFDVNTGLPRLVTVACSKDSITQRAGRAGRTQEGFCRRLFTEGEFHKFSEHSLPEISSTDLVPTALLLAEWGCTSLEEILHDMQFVDAPPVDSMKKSFEMLMDLDALEEYKALNSNKKLYRITGHGKALSRLNTHPRFATCISRAAGEGKVSLAAAVIATAILEEDLSGKEESNLAVRVRNVLKDGLSTYNGKQIISFASRISPDAESAVLDAMSGNLLVSDVVESVGRSLLPGFIDLVAQRKGDASYGGSTYMLSLGRSGRLDGKQNEGEYIVVADTSTGDDGKTRIRAYSSIDLKVLNEISSEIEEMYAVASKGYEVRARRVSKVGSLVLSSTPLPSPPPDKIVEVLIETIASLGGVPALIPMQSKKDISEINELRQRVSLARKLSADGIDWPECFGSLESVERGRGTEKDQDILNELLEPWLPVAGSVKGIELKNILQSTLSIDQQNWLDNFLPEKIDAPDGSGIPVTYHSDVGPTASAKLQQFFGVSKTPTVGPRNEIPVCIDLLSPSGKLLAQTKDLEFFWKESYPSVRAEMRGKYPKHPWPEEPMSAIASRLTKKQQASQMGHVDNTDSKSTNNNKKKKNKR